MNEAFFAVHCDLDREGPGEPADVHWALAQVGRPARVLDAACGPGADTVTLAECLPDAEIRAVDMQASFVEQARKRTQAYGARVSCAADDMFAQSGPFDFIWCAGAIYFAGVTQGLSDFAKQLAPGGHVVFSEPVAPRQDAPEAARAIWADYPALTDQTGVEAHIQAAGFQVLATRRIVGAPWAAYYTPMQARIDHLRTDAKGDLLEALDEAQHEIDLWRAAKDDVVYMLFVTQPA